MTNSNDCQNRREAIAALVLGELETPAADELKRHIGTCRTCFSFYQMLVEEEEMIRSAFKVISDRGQTMADRLVEQLDKASRRPLPRSRAVLHRLRLGSRTIKQITAFAAAAGIIVAAGIGIALLNRPERTNVKQEIAQPTARPIGQIDSQTVPGTAANITTGNPKKLEAELRRIKKMYVARDVGGLVAILSEGEFESKVTAANYLAEIGDLESLVILEQLNDEYGSNEHAFANAIEAIENRNAGVKTEDTQGTVLVQGGEVVEQVGEDLLGLVPAKSLFCMRVNNFDYTLNTIDQFLVGVSPVPMGVSMLTRMKFAQILGGPQLNGVKMGGHFAIFGTLLNEESTETNPALNIFIGILVPVTDYQQFITGNPNCGQADERGVSKIKNGDKDIMLVTQIGNYALAAPIISPNVYDRLVSLSKSLSSSEATGLGSILSTDQANTAKNEPIWVYGNIQLVSKVFGPMLFGQLEQAKTAMIESMKSSGQVEASALMFMYVNIFEMLVKETQLAVAAVRPKPNACSVTIAVSALPQTEVASLLVADISGQVQNRLLRYLQDGAAITEAVNIKTPFFQKFCAKCIDLFAAVSGDNVSAEDIAKMKTLLTDMIDSLGGSLVYSLWIDAENQPPFAVDYVFEVEDTNKFDRASEEAMELWTSGCIAAFYNSIGIKTSCTMNKGVEDYNGVSIDSAKLTMWPTDFSSPQGRMIDAMYADGLQCRSAIVNGLGICTVGSDADSAIRALIDDIKAGAVVQPGTEIETALALLPQANKADFMFTLNYVRLLNMAFAIARMAGQINIPQIDVPTKNNIVLAATVQPGKMVIDAAVPKEHLIEIVAASQAIKMSASLTTNAKSAALEINANVSANKPTVGSPNDVNLPLTMPIRAFDSNSLSGFPIARGWPVALPGSVTGTPVPADLDGDGDMEVVVPCMERGYWDKHPKINVVHPSPDISAQLFAFHHDGTLVKGWPVILADRKMRELSRKGKPRHSENWNSSPSVMDLDNDGKDEIIIANCEARRSVWVLNGDGTPRVFPQGTGHSDPWASVPLVDVDGDGVIDLILSEVHVTVEGNPIPGWPQSRMFHDGYVPCAGDADGDGELEFYMPFYSKTPFAGYDRFGNILPGWPTMKSGNCAFPPVMGDVAGDEKMEICAAGWNNRIMLWTWDGKSVLPNADPNKDPNIFKDGISSAWASLSLADLNGDGKAEIIAFDSRTRTLRAWYGDNKGMAHDEGIIVALPEARCLGGVTVGDLGGDGEIDFFVSTYWVRLAKDNTVTVTNMLPKSVQSTTQCTITDIDLDGYTDILFGLADGRVFVYNTGMVYKAEWMQWPTQNANLRHTGVWRRPD